MISDEQVEAARAAYIQYVEGFNSDDARRGAMYKVYRIHDGVDDIISEHPDRASMELALAAISIRAALEAALAAKPGMVSEDVAIKPLAWEPGSDEEDPLWELADTVVGRYSIELGELCLYACAFERLDRIELATNGDMKQVAQLDFERRIRSAISTNKSEEKQT